MSELLPCPFCESEAESSIAYIASMISCKNEKCIMIGCLIDNEPWVDEIEKKWNEQFSIKEIAHLRALLKQAEPYLQQQEIEELKSLIKEATPWVTCVKGTLPEYRQAIATKVLIEWLEKAEKIK